MPINYIIMAIMITIDLIFIIIPTLMTVSRRRKLRSYDYDTDAVVTDVHQESMSTSVNLGHRQGSRMWVPTFRYRYGGHTYQHKSHVGMSEKTFEVGQKIPIKVSTDDPTRFVLLKSRAYNLTMIILCSMAACFVAATVAVGFFLPSQLT